MHPPTPWILLVMTATTLPLAAETVHPEFLRQYAETHRFDNGKPAAVEVTPGGDAVLFLRSPARSPVRDLYSFDPATGKERRLLTAEALLGGGEEQLTAEEKARRERMRLSARGIASYVLSDDGERILAPVSDRLFVVERKSGEVRELDVGDGFPIDPRFSPDATRVAYAMDGDLYVADVAGGRPQRLTRRHSDTVTHGLPEFVAQEEMDRDHGYWWSPDGTRLAYQRTETAGMEVFRIIDPADPGKAPQEWPYPRPGKKNAEVELGVVPVDGGDTVWVRWDRERYPYLATVHWTRGAPLTLLVQNREQTEEALLAVDPATGAADTLLIERDEAWINLDQDMPYWLPGGQWFLWTSEREGSWQLELRTREGELRHAVTPAGFGYRGFVRFDEAAGAVYVHAGSDPTEKHLWRLPLDPALGEPERLTEEPGVHTVDFSADGRTRVDAYEAPREAPQWLVHGSGGGPVRRIRSEEERPMVDVRPEFLTVGDSPEFHAAVLRPRDFDPGKRYPVIVAVYGGPHAQVVKKSRDVYLFNQWLADQGFIVTLADGRGTPNRGRAWERAIRYDFIDKPLADQVAALRALGARFPEMDLERVGIYGWSFGGYFTAMAVMRRPELFQAGFAGAPVTDWQDYDTHYTERYIGLPQEAPQAYEKSSVLTYAAGLERPLLIVHGTADDNVYFSHALKLQNALLRAGRPADLLALSGLTHMVPEATVMRRMHERMLGFFEEHLRRPSSPE
jgi:dipeptidyl-peptidase-4